MLLENQAIMDMDLKMQSFHSQEKAVSNIYISGGVKQDIFIV